MVVQRKLVLEEEVPYLTGRAWELKKGQYIRVMARHTVDFVAFNLHNLSERFDQARTKTNQLKIFVTKGDVLFSKDNNVMLTIVEDTWKWHHDMQKGTCSRKKFEMNFQDVSVIKHDVWGQEHPTPRWSRWEDLPPRGCWENLMEALKPWNISQWDIPSPINLFQNMRIDGETGRMWYDHKELDEGKEDAVVEMRAEMDLLVAAANDVDGVEPFHIQVYDERASSL